MIAYHTVGVEMPPIQQAEVSQWVKAVAATYQRTVGDINFVFVSDEEILRINREYVHHDYYTDHIGFDYSTGQTIAGDIYIGIETVQTNAPLVGASYDEELHRVVIHGVLHLCGIDDKEPGERAIMEAAENSALELLKQMRA